MLLLSLLLTVVVIVVVVVAVAINRCNQTQKDIKKQNKNNINFVENAFRNGSSIVLNNINAILSLERKRFAKRV